MHQKKWAVLGTIVVLVLAGCGGGGSASPEPSPTAMGSPQSNPSETAGNATDTITTYPPGWNATGISNRRKVTVQTTEAVADADITEQLIQGSLLNSGYRIQRTQLRVDRDTQRAVKVEQTYRVSNATAKAVSSQGIDALDDITPVRQQLVLLNASGTLTVISQNGTVVSRSFKTSVTFADQASNFPFYYPSAISLSRGLRLGEPVITQTGYQYPILGGGQAIHVSSGNVTGQILVSKQGIIKNLTVLVSPNRLPLFRYKISISDIRLDRPSWTTR